MNFKFRKSKAGLLLLGSERFKELGSGLQKGTYGERKMADIEILVGALKETYELAFPGIVYTTSEMKNAMNLFYTGEVDFIIAEFLSWSEDNAWIHFLRDMPEVPVLFVNPMKERMTFENTLDEDDFIDFLCSGTLVGSLEAAGSIPRIGRKHVKIISGSRERILEQIGSFAKAAKVRSILKRSTLGLLANYNQLMWSTYIDPYNLFSRIGPQFHSISYSTLADEIADVDDQETEIYRNELLSGYRIMDDVDEKKFFESVRASIGLAKLAVSRGIDILVFNDLDPAMFKLIGLRPGFYHPLLNENLTVLVPEGDIGGGLITFIMKLISGGKHVSFIEPFHVELSDNTFAGGHAGPNDHNDPGFTNNVVIARDVRFAKTQYKYAGAPFAWFRIPEGRKTMAQLTENNGSYNLVCTLVDSLPGEHILASYSHTVFRPLMPVAELFEQVLKIGTTQHFAVVDGDHRKELEILAELMDFKYYEIV